MTVIETIIRLPRTVLTMMVVSVLWGTLIYLTIPKEADPDIDVPVFYVSIPYPGISPEDGARLIVKPMETEIRGIDGLKELTAIASTGHVGLIAEFEIDKDHSEASRELREKVDQAKAEIPSAAEEPSVNEINFSLFPVIVVSLSGQVPERTLYQNARKLKTAIEAIPSVLEANLAGHREELLEVLIDPVKLESYELTQADLIRAVTANNQLIAAGDMDAGRGRFSIKVPGLIETGLDVAAIPVKVSGDGIVTLGEVAEVRRTFKDATSYSRFNGEPAIAIQVVKRLGTNIVENNNEVRRVVAEFTKEWPDAIKVNLALDQSKFIFEILGSLQSSILTAIALVMIVVVAAMGLRSALLVGIAIPTSFMLGFILVQFAGMTVNLMLMFGLVLTVGILVDGAIIVTEYADRKMAEGLPRREAYGRAARLMFWPVTSSTLTTLAAFLPLLLWPGVSGEFMSYLPITVIFVLSASLITALIFLPVMGSLFGKSTADATEIATAKMLSGSKPVDYAKVPGLSGAYARMIKRLIYHPAKVLIAALAVMYAIFTAYAANNNGVEFFVDTEPEQAIVFVSGRGNMAAADQLALVKEVEAQVLQVGGLSAVFTAVGASSGGVEIGSGATDAPADQIGQITVELADYGQRRPGKEILEEIRQRTKDIPGIKVEVRKREDGPPVGKTVRLEVRGGDLDQLYATAARVRTHLETGMTGMRDFDDTRPLPGIEWVLRVNRTEAGRFGADVQQVGAMVQLVTNGVLVGEYRPDDSEDDVEIRVRMPEGDRTLDQLDALRVPTAQGLVPLANFVERSAQPKVSNIVRKDGAFLVVIKADAMPGVNGDSKVQELDTWIKSQTWPEGTSFRFRGADEEQKESGAFLGQAMAGALFIMFIILVTQYNSFYSAILTLSTVVMSIIGVLLGMMVTGQPFSIIMTGTGVVALAGIVVNNSIILIDTFNRHRDAGISKVDAAIRASAQRLRPVLLTTITTICGLLPMALQLNIDFFAPSIQIGSLTSVWWVALSTAIISGLAFATVLTLILTPVLLAMPEVYANQWARLRGRPVTVSRPVIGAQPVE